MTVIVGRASRVMPWMHAEAADRRSVRPVTPGWAAPAKPGRSAAHNIHVTIDQDVERQAASEHRDDLVDEVIQFSVAAELSSDFEQAGSGSQVGLRIRDISRLKTAIFPSFPR